MYVFGCKLSLVRLCDSEFGIPPVDNITIRDRLCCLLLPHGTYFFRSSWYLFCLSVIVWARLCVLGAAMSIKKVFFVFLFIKVKSGLLKSYYYY